MHLLIVSQSVSQLHLFQADQIVNSIFRVSTQHHLHTFSQKVAYTQKTIPARKFVPYWNPKYFRTFVCAVLVEDQELEEAPPRKTRAALQHLEAARKGRAAARKLDDHSDDEESSEESDRDENQATRIIEGRKRLRKRA